MTIRQIPTKNTTVRAVLHCAAFIKGHSDAVAGKPFNYDAYRNPNDQWNYERGRLFACVWKLPIKHNKKVRADAAMAFGNAISTNLIF